MRADADVADVDPHFGGATNASLNDNNYSTRRKWIDTIGIIELDASNAFALYIVWTDFRRWMRFVRHFCI